MTIDRQQLGNPAHIRRNAGAQDRESTRLTEPRQCSSPQLVSRDGHGLFLGDLFRGQTAFLLCGGPSLKQLDLAQLNQRGLLTMAVNNAAALFRPQLWCCIDQPRKFCDAIWRDPGILKFIPLQYMDSPISVRDEQDQLVLSSERAGEMPGVCGCQLNWNFVAERWLYEETFNCGNEAERCDAYGNTGSQSVLLVALKLSFYLGVRRLYLIGCDFRMEYGRENYAFPQARSRQAVRGNNRTYHALNVRLGHLKPYFDAAGFQVINCTPKSGLTAFPYVPFALALRTALSRIPSEIITAGMYEWRPPDQDNPKTSQ